MRRFSEVEDLLLRDLPLNEESFTWSGGLNNQSQSRLDCFLVFERWEDHCSGVVQCILLRFVPDHSPILLDGGWHTKKTFPF